MPDAPTLCDRTVDAAVVLHRFRRSLSLSSAFGVCCVVADVLALLGSEVAAGVLASILEEVPVDAADPDLPGVETVVAVLAG